MELHSQADVRGTAPKLRRSLNKPPLVGRVRRVGHVCRLSEAPRTACGTTHEDGSGVRVSVRVSGTYIT